jgi:predicted acetyltransferase
MKPVDAEYGAWETTVLSSIATGQKTLTLPGGYVVWSTAWAPSDRNKMVGDAITSYLASWSAFGK